VRPLASPVRESTVSAVTNSIGGVLFLVVAMAVSPSTHTVLRFLGAAACWSVFFGAFMYLIAFRHFVQNPAEPPIAGHESASATVARRVREDAAKLALLAFVVFIFAEPALGGFVLGNGVLSGIAAYRWHTWERRHGAQLLRLPSWTWDRKQPFYAVTDAPN